MIRTRTPILLLSGTALLLVTACTDPGYVAGQDPNQKTKQGAILGGILGEGRILDLRGPSRPNVIRYNG